MSAVFNCEVDEISKAKLYGECTKITLNTCSVGGHKVPRALISAILVLKKACAVANNKLGKLSTEKMSGIISATKLIQAGKFDDQFELEVFQNGAGTSTNMNVNEVISSVAGKIFNIELWPNDDVNMSQSTNDIVPSALNISCSILIKNCLLPSLEAAFIILRSYAEGWKNIIKIGRTHMQDAVPMTLGQEFSGYAKQIEKCIERCHRGMQILKEISIGGTAIGTGLNAPSGFSKIVIEEINNETGLKFIEAENKFCEQSSRDCMIELSGIINSITAALHKIASDLKILSSGPRAGISEIALQTTQPGSSIMPGKVNPIMCEAMLQVCHYVNGMMLTVLLGAKNGELQLNTATMIIAYAMLDSISVLANSINNFSEFCLKGIKPNVKLMNENARKSLMLITAVTPLIGYEKATEIVNDAVSSGKTVIESLKNKNLISNEIIDQLCDPQAMACCG